MIENFTFNKVTDEEAKRYAENSNVFNLPEDEIMKEKVVLASFSDERFGSSEEKLDIAVFNNNEWHVLDIDGMTKGYNEIPLGYVLKDRVFSRVLVIVRRMSTFIADRKKDGFHSYVFCKVPEKYKDVSKDKALFGLLAKSHVYLDKDEEDIKSQIQSKIVERNDEICSRLFQ